MKDNPDLITPRDAIARFAGVLLLVAVGFLHLLDLSHKVDEGIWYMALLFVGLIAGAIVLSVGLVRSAPESVRLLWVGAALLAGGALWGYFVSRTIPLPGMADHQGDWINLYGVLAGLAEVTLLGVAAFAMRDLTVRGVAHVPRVPVRLPGSGALSALMLLAVVPQQAFAHGGEDDEAAAEAGAGAGSGSSAGGGSGADPATPSTAAAGGHGDPFLGTSELVLAFGVCVGFVAWAARTLIERTKPVVIAS